MEQNEEENIILKEKEFTLISDNNNEYRVKVFITSNDLFCINLFSTNNNDLSKKYSLSLSLEDLIRNRFFKMFINLASFVIKKRVNFKVFLRFFS